MIASVAEFACFPPDTERLSAIRNFVAEVDVKKSPIDQFFDARTEIIKRLKLVDASADDPTGRLLLLGLVSAFEHYVRGILSGCLGLCPNSQARSSEKNLNLGGAVWHGSFGEFNKSAFEHKSFADAKELKKTFAEYINFSLERSEFQDVLNEFEKIMQLRHAAIHANGIVPGRNAVKLELPRANRYIQVRPGSVELQEIAAVLSNLVKLINRHLFEEMCKRWAVDWRKRADWEPADEGRLFNNLWALFVSAADIQSRPKPRTWTRAALKQALASKYDLE